MEEKTITRFICDACGYPIGKVEDGYIEWIGFPTQVGFGLRLVHGPEKGPKAPYGRCMYDEEAVRRICGGKVKDHHLEHFLGLDGYRILRGLIERRELPEDEVNKMMVRLNIFVT